MNAAEGHVMKYVNQRRNSNFRIFACCTLGENIYAYYDIPVGLRCSYG